MLLGDPQGAAPGVPRPTSCPARDRRNDQGGPGQLGRGPVPVAHATPEPARHGPRAVDQGTLVNQMSMRVEAGGQVRYGNTGTATIDTVNNMQKVV